VLVISTWVVAGLVVCMLGRAPVHVQVTSLASHEDVGLHYVARSRILTTASGRGGGLEVYAAPR